MTQPFNQTPMKEIKKGDTFQLPEHKRDVFGNKIGLLMVEVIAVSKSSYIGQITATGAITEIAIPLD